MQNFHTLLVEDDPLIAKSLSIGLPFAGFTLTVCSSYEEGSRMVRGGGFDIVLLDINLPDGSGFDLCREIRAHDTEIPVLMLTANTSEESAVKGIGSGADDYIRKPYGIHELTARMHRLLEKRQRKLDCFGSLRVDARGFQAWTGDTELDLGKREFLILSLLVSRAGEVVTREEILSATDHNAEIYDRTIDSHISHLRRKLKSSSAPEKIVTVYGVGYRLQAS